METNPFKKPNILDIVADKVSKTINSDTTLTDLKKSIDNIATELQPVTKIANDKLDAHLQLTAQLAQFSPNLCKTQSYSINNTTYTQVTISGVVVRLNKLFDTSLKEVDCAYGINIKFDINGQEIVLFPGQQIRTQGFTKFWLKSNDSNNIVVNAFITVETTDILVGYVKPVFPFKDITTGLYRPASIDSSGNVAITGTVGISNTQFDIGTIQNPLPTGSNVIGKILGPLPGGTNLLGYVNVNGQAQVTIQGVGGGITFPLAADGNNGNTLIGMVRAYQEEFTGFKAAYDWAAAVAAQTVYDPGAGNRFNLIDIMISTSAACTITLFYDSDDLAHRIFKLWMPANAVFDHQLRRRLTGINLGSKIQISTSAAGGTITVLGYLST